jgi:Ca-activated chloride channel family protein
MDIKANYYDLLGLPRDAIPDEIRRAYHEAALRMHPDVSPEPSATEIFLRIQQAYEVLIDPEIRREYDNNLKSENNDPVKVDILYSRPNLTKISESQIIYALVDFSAVDRFKTSSGPPLNISLVLDRSTSMQGSRMDTVKTAAIELLRQLKPEDMLSIVVFSDRAEVLLSAGKRPDGKIIETQIQMVRAGGGTEIYQGLGAGFAEIQRNINRSLINHIILLTDGRTYGDEEECLFLANQAAEKGIRITGLGIGTEWNDVFLDEIASRTGGTSVYISKVDDIRNFLHDKFNSLNQVFAERVILNLKPEEDVTISSAFRLQPESAIISNTANLQLGSIPKNTDLSVLLEFVVSNVPDDQLRKYLARGELYSVLASSPSSKASIPISFSRVTGDSPGTDLPPRRIFQALSQITLYRMQERARQEVAEGKVQEASVRLQRLATQLLSLGEHDLAQTAFVEAERIQQTHMLSAEGEKRIKYGTRSLLLPASIDEERAR